MTRNPDNRKLAVAAVQAVGSLGEAFLRQESELPPRDIPPREIAERLGIALTPDGHPFEEVVERLGRILEFTPSSSSPRFFNQLFGGREPVATLAEMLVALADTSMYTYKVAGAQVLVEREVLARLLAAVPFPGGEGTFSPGGSLANMTAMVIARNEAAPEVREQGLAGRRLRAYSSADSHYSIRKAAGILGLGRSSTREVPTDADGRLRPAALERQIIEDRASGDRPFFINATAGTTVLGAIDPLTEISRIAREQGVWLHVDGALGASLLLSSSYRDRLAGIAESDSVAWNAHKMIGVPLACSVLLLRRPGLLGKHLGESANYLFQADGEDLNPGLRSLQCGRRSDALKLWALWQQLGDRGLDRRMTRMLDLARFAAGAIDDDPQLDLVVEPQTVNVCFRVRGASSVDLCDYLDRSGILKIGHGMVDASNAIRLVCVNPDLDEERILQVLAEIKDAAGAMGAARR